MLSAAVKGGRPPTPGAPGVCAVTDQAAVLVASNTHTHTHVLLWSFLACCLRSKFVYKLSALWFQIIVEVNINRDFDL